jgi:hypothetical protein
MGHQFVEKDLGEVGDDRVALDDHRQRRRLHPADGAEHALCTV